MLKYKNLQEVFDRIFMVVHGLGMNEKNLNAKLPSYEHLPFGCFIGLCLPKNLAKDLQKEAMTHWKYAIESVVENKRSSKVFQEVYEIFQNIHTSQLQDLQSIHDGIAPYEWDSALRMFAVLNGLTVPQMYTESWNANVAALKKEFTVTPF